jgi:hypothetical protein
VFTPYGDIEGRDFIIVEDVFNTLSTFMDWQSQELTALPVVDLSQFICSQAKAEIRYWYLYRDSEMFRVNGMYISAIRADL